jgi:subtilisin family serine protease
VVAVTRAVARAVARGAAVNVLAAVAAPFISGCSDPGSSLGPRLGSLRPAVSSAEKAAAPFGDSIPGAYIVTFRDTVQDVPGLAARLVQASGGTHRYTYSAALRGFAARLPAPALEALRRNPRVAYVEPDRTLHESDVQPGPTWGLDRIDQRALPLDKAYTFGSAGAGVTAYILDGGIRFSHRDFEGRAVRGVDLIGDGMDGGDCRGHGTHVAATVGGRTWGVAKKVALVSVRVMDCNGAGTVSGAIAGLDWVARNRRLPAVANLSIGSVVDESFNAAVRGLIASGVQVSIAAGNSDADACTFSPSSTSEAVVVGAAGDAWDNKRRIYSNWGGCVDLFAPGSGVVSASHLDDTLQTTRSGTSMAAPHAAGVMALWLSDDPSLSPAQLHQLIVTTATQDVVTDAKGPNAHLLYAVRAAVPPPAPAPTPPTAEFTAACTRLACTFDATSSTPGSAGIARYDWVYGDGAVGAGTSRCAPTRPAGSYIVTLT